MKLLVNLAALLSVIQVYVKWAEESLKSGEEKKAAVVNAVIETLKAINIDLSAYANVIGLIVDIVVFFFNALGIFMHKTKG